MAATLVYTSSVEMTARREAAAARREAAREREFVRVLALVRAEGEWFNVKVDDEMGRHRGQGYSAESVARMLVDPETSLEYWPAEREQDESGVSWRWGRGFVEH
jgi:hypothetical protein